MVAAPADCKWGSSGTSVMLNPYTDSAGCVNKESSLSPYKHIKNFKNHLTVNDLLLNSYAAINFII